MFIARVSRGRFVREFVFCVIVIPTLVCVVWMGVFGGTAISQVMANAAAPVKDAALELKLFEMLKPLPVAGVTSFIGIVLVLVFFVTSSDSGSLVIDTITAGGKTDAPVSQRVFWCTFEGVVAATLLLVGGGRRCADRIAGDGGLDRVPVHDRPAGHVRQPGDRPQSGPQVRELERLKRDYPAVETPRGAISDEPPALAVSERLLTDFAHRCRSIRCSITNC